LSRALDHSIFSRADDLDAQREALCDVLRWTTLIGRR
jgi:hypothetical protein